MIERFARFPAALAQRARTTTLAGGTVPALLAHPDWRNPAPVMLWMHGRTVNKELDPGRYLRWIRAGIAACSIDLPGHGQRLDRSFHKPERTVELLEQALGEIDAVVESLAEPRWEGVFDLDRIGIGGMSAGGMAALRRLCDDHPFSCAAVESTTGDLHELYFGGSQRPWPVRHAPDRVARIDPARHLDSWRPIPLLALHSEADEIIPIAGMRAFIEKLRGHYRRAGADPGLIRFVTWPGTGAPYEHSGFGKKANDAKNEQTDFLRQHLSPAAVS